MADVVDEIPARERLLAAATRLFIAHGFDGTPVSRIVREAKVTMPALYYHFGNKFELLQAVIAARGAWMRTDLNVDPQAGYAANCRSMIDHALQHLPELRDGLRLRLQLGFESGPEASDLHHLVKEQRDKSITGIAGLFALALPGASEPRLAWLAEVYLFGVQALALDLIGAYTNLRLQAAKADNLLHTLIAAAQMPEGELPTHPS